MAEPIVFISYSHRRRRVEGSSFVRPSRGSRSSKSHFDPWNDERIGAGDDWYTEIELAAMDAAELGSASDLRGVSRLRLHPDARRSPADRATRARGPAHRSHSRPRKCDWKKVDWLARDADAARRRAPDCPRRGTLRSTSEFADIAEESTVLLQACDPPAPEAAKRILSKPDLTRLPPVGEHLFGREDELALLDDAWADETNIISLVAWGGAGKSALVNHWLGTWPARSFAAPSGSTAGRSTARAPKRTRPRRMSSSRRLSRWFGEPDPETVSARQKGARLAGLIQRSGRCSSWTAWSPCRTRRASQGGKLKDQALAELYVTWPGRIPGSV